MRASVLKKKYPDFWDNVECAVKQDVLYLIQDSKITKEAVGVIAHNAAFVACSEYHRRWEYLRDELDAMRS